MPTAGARPGSAPGSAPGPDLLVGLTVAMVALPQAVAFALLSGVPPAHGIATAAVAALVAGLVGRSAQVASGTTLTTSLLILGAMAPYLGKNGIVTDEGLPILATLALLAGVLRLALALGGGAALVRFLPESVLVGFTAGAAALIVGMQVDEALGLPAVRADTLRGQAAGLVRMLAQGHRPNLLAVALAVAVVLLVLLGRRHVPRAPVALLAVVGASLLAWAGGLSEASGLPLVLDRTFVPTGWPRIALPRADPAVLESLLVPACAIVLLGTLELTVSARAGGARPDMKREILAQGFANVAVSFTGGFPASASFTRSALLRLLNARTRLATIATGLFTVPVVLFASGLLGRIPLPALAGVLMAAAWSMLDPSSIRRLVVSSPETRLLFLLTFGATLVLPLQWAVLVGSGTGLVIHLARTSTPRLTLFVPRGDRLVPAGAAGASGTVVLEVSGNLHYAAVPAFETEAEAMLGAGVRLAVLDLSHAHEIRFAALCAFERLAAELEREGARVVLAGVAQEVVDLLARSGSPLAWVAAEAEPGRSVAKALQMGRQAANADPTIGP